jgi:hypothetical protein
VSDPGWLYVARCDRYPGKVKIGLTRRDGTTRACELTRDGYCLPWHTPGGAWEVVHQRAAEHCIAAERRAHLMLADRRVAWSREIFDCRVEQAMEVVDAVAGYTGQGRGLPPRPVGSYRRGHRYDPARRRFSAPWPWWRSRAVFAVLSLSALFLLWESGVVPPQAARLGWRVMLLLHHLPSAL